ncbi:MAG: hypothetical protein ACR2MQ_13480 [Gemmatimonadaceae bacterium]
MKDPAAGEGSKQNGGGKNGGKNDTGKSTSPAKRDESAVSPSPRFDAIFFTKAAIDHFVVPFYNKRHEGEGDRISKEYAARSNEIYAIGHMPGCGLVALEMEAMTIVPPFPLK